MHLEKLDRIMSTISSGLRINSLILVANASSLTAPDTARRMLDLGIVDPEDNLRKKTESIKVGFDQMYEEGLLTKFKGETGEFNTPVSCYQLNTLNPYALATVELALINLRVFAKNGIPIQEFWNFRGGSYSPELKHITRGELVAGFYGIPRQELEKTLITVPIEEFKPLELTGQQWGEFIQKGDYKSHLTKLHHAGLVRKTKNLKGNKKIWTLTDLASNIETQAFIPSLRVITAAAQVLPSTKMAYQEQLDYMKELNRLHYASTTNQFTNPNQSKD